MNVISERFGLEAVQDSVMAVSAFISLSLSGEDAIFHWSETSLLVVFHTTVTPQALTIAVHRIIDSHREITIQSHGHSVMVRVPLEFKITPIDSLRSAQDLAKLY